MNELSLALIVIRGLATLFEANGDTRQANSLRLLAKGIEGGKDINEHMKQVAQALDNDDPLDWDTVIERIEANSDW